MCGKNVTFGISKFFPVLRLSGSNIWKSNWDIPHTLASQNSCLKNVCPFSKLLQMYVWSTTGWKCVRVIFQSFLNKSADFAAFLCFWMGETLQKTCASSNGTFFEVARAFVSPLPRMNLCFPSSALHKRISSHSHKLSILRFYRHSFFFFIRPGTFYLRR